MGTRWYSVDEIVAWLEANLQMKKPRKKKKKR